jgi:hypothetical protein
MYSPVSVVAFADGAVVRAFALIFLVGTVSVSSKVM